MSGVLQALAMLCRVLCAVCCGCGAVRSHPICCVASNTCITGALCCVQRVLCHHVSSHLLCLACVYMHNRWHGYDW